jgi:predicted TIM-barrel fold metal-dependent hydrolase
MKHTMILLLSLFLTIASIPAGSMAEMPRVGYIDAHGHIFGITGGRGGSNDYPGAVKEALSQMDKAGISMMIVMPPPFTGGQRGVFEASDFVSAIREYPGRFAFLGGGGTLNVMIQNVAPSGEINHDVRTRFEEQAKSLITLGVSGFGEMTAEHFSLNSSHPYESTPPDHPLFFLLADIAARHDVPIDLHMEAVPRDMPLPDERRLKRGNTPARLKANLAAFERLLAHNRKAKIIWAHAGWCNTDQRTVKLMDDMLGRNPNLYMTVKIGKDSMESTRPLTSEMKIKGEWIDLVRKYPDRFMIGSDQFYLTPMSPLRQPPGRLEPITAFMEQLPPDLAYKIGNENPKRIFKLGK